MPLQGSSNFESKDFSFVLITICNRFLFKGESEKKKRERKGTLHSPQNVSCKGALSNMKLEIKSNVPLEVLIQVISNIR